MNLSRLTTRRAPIAMASILVGIALALPSVTLAAGGPIPLSGTSTVRVTPPSALAAALVRGPGNGRLFRSQCTPSHVAKDDPIVFPGQPGASHEHVFFGNVTTDADSTLASLQNQPTSCRIPGDQAAYWIPSLLASGTHVAPKFVNAYYLADGARGHVMPFPAGLKVIAGNSKATTAQSTTILGWKCANQAGGRLSATPIACRANVDQVLVIRFPDCWNGHDLDSADHKSHLAYRAAGVCPAGYPVALPQLSLNVHYRLPSLANLTLASGSIYSAHADFFNAWNQTVLANLVRRNLN